MGIRWPGCGCQPHYGRLRQSLWRHLQRWRVWVWLRLRADALRWQLDVHLLYDFTGGSDGANPAGSLAMDANGNLYGTTYAGGITGSHCDPRFGSQCGVIFEIMP
jgi:hypothetical protein